MIRRRPVLSAVTLGYLLLVALITLTPQDQSAPEDGIFQVIVRAIQDLPGAGWLTFEGIEFAANVALFVPVGIFVTLLVGARRAWLAAVFAIAVTCAIETVQIAIPGRVPDVRDLVANTSGALVGIVFTLGAAAFSRARQKRHPRSAGVSG